MAIKLHDLRKLIGRDDEYYYVVKADLSKEYCGERQFLELPLQKFYDFNDLIKALQDICIVEDGTIANFEIQCFNYEQDGRKKANLILYLLWKNDRYTVNEVFYKPQVNRVA